MQVRDHALSVKDDLPKSDVNKEYFIQNAEKEVKYVTGAGKNTTRNLRGRMSLQVEGSVCTYKNECQRNVVCK